MPSRNRSTCIMALTLSFAIIAIRSAVPAALAHPQRAVVVDTTEGAVRGVPGDGVIAWMGIPYAAPPVGALRWRPTQPPAGRATVLDAAAFGSACPQVAANPLRPQENGPKGQEDCLTLNIWSPTEGDGPWPVMVWIHGGGHVQGTAGDPIYDGASLARDRKVVVASFNYRLGALGYLAQPALAEPGGSGTVAGNYGLLDQIAALAWLRRNLAGFGGDPERLAIFGESAGGLSVCALMASPLASGLFGVAIMESGGCPPAQSLRALAPSLPGQREAFEQGRRFASAIGCAGQLEEAACLRAQPLDKVLATLLGSIGILQPDAETYAEIVDGWALPMGMAEAVSYGHAAPVPWLIGANADEATMFMSAAQKGMSYESFSLLVRQLYKGDAERVLATYPASDYPSGGDALAAVTGDVGFVCPARRIAGWHAAAGHSAWLYHFTHVTEVAKRLGLGAHHGAEIAFIFGMTANGPLTLRGEPAALRDAMRAWWTGMAAFGSPPALDMLDWPIYDGVGNVGMQLDTPPGPVSGWRDARCDLWDEISAGMLAPDQTPIRTATPVRSPTATPQRSPEPSATTPATAPATATVVGGGRRIVLPWLSSGR